MIVYLVKNVIDGKIYVGKTSLKLSTRWNNHIAHAKQNSSTHLHRAIRKYGPDSFTISLLATASTLKELSELETKYIAELSSNAPEIGYNFTAGGEGTVGYKHTLDTRLHMSLSPRPPISEAQRKKISVAGLGRKHTQQQRALIVAANKRRIAAVCGDADYKMCCNCGQYDDPSDMKVTPRKSGSLRFLHTKESKNWQKCKEIFRCAKS